MSLGGGQVFILILIGDNRHDEFSEIASRLCSREGESSANRPEKSGSGATTLQKTDEDLVGQINMALEDQ